MSSRLKIFTVFYILLLVGIVAIANNKGTRYLLRFGVGIPYFDKIAHFFLMGGFSFLLNLVFRARTFSFGNIGYLLGTCVVLVIVTLEEFSQIFISGRAFDLGDLAADYLGIFIFGELARVVYRKYRVES